MPRVIHVVATSSFAGVEQHVVDASRETAARGWDVTVIGGDELRMTSALDGAAEWRPGGDPASALWSLSMSRRTDVCHAHMTVAETVALAARPFHRAPVISTRHFAGPRGSMPVGRLAAPWIARRLSREIAVSEFVASRVERRPDAVILNGVRDGGLLWRPENRVVLVLQRLEPEKDTLTALAAWLAADLAGKGWSLRIVGDGAERPLLERWVDEHRVPAVEFLGWSDDVPAHFGGAAVLLASALAEPFGLAVVEAMAAGVPVIASAAGGHMETIGRVAEARLFPPGNSVVAAEALRGFAPEGARRAASDAVRRFAQRDLTLSAQVDALLDQYDALRSPGSRPRPRSQSELAEIVVCSLEPWDEVWRRNQFLLDQLLGRNPRLRVLFVEPPSDILFDLWNRRPLRRPRLRVVGYEGRLRAFRPLKPLPRRLGGLADAALLRQVEVASRLAGFSRPVLWINDVSYAPLIERTGWPSIYDVTDDWLLAPFGERELGRLRRLDRLALSRSDEVVVCSKALAASRRPVQRLTVIPNAADVEHFKRPRRRPPDLPQTPVMVYVGTLQEGRLDVGLVAELARDLPSVALVLVGPDALSQASRNRLAALPNLVLLGPRPYEDVPAYFQHADVFVIPHVVSPFTDSLDPIKAYECAAVGVPTVTTPVAGLRCEGPSLRVAARPSFPREVKRLLRERPPRTPATVPTWQTRSEQYEEVIGSALRRSNQRAFT